MESHDYLFSWVDSLKEGQSMGRGVFQRANHDKVPDLRYQEQKRISVPCRLPTFTVNRVSVASFNALYFTTSSRHRRSRRYLIDFFYPLDQIAKWRNIYGKNGLIEYQAVVPSDRSYETIFQMMKKVTRSKLASGSPVA